MKGKQPHQERKDFWVSLIHRKRSLPFTAFRGSSTFPQGKAEKPDCRAKAARDTLRARCDGNRLLREEKRHGNPHLRPQAGFNHGTRPTGKQAYLYKTDRHAKEARDTLRARCDEDPHLRPQAEFNHGTRLTNTTCDVRLNPVKIHGAVRAYSSSTMT